MRWLHGCLVTLIALGSLLNARPAFAQGGRRAVDEDGEWRDRIHLTLTAEVVGPQTVHLALAAVPELAAPTLQVTWEVGTAQLAGGPANETLTGVAVNQTVQQSRSAALPGPGVYPLAVYVTYQARPGAQYGAAGMVFAIVDAAGGVTLTTSDPNARSPMHSIIPAEVTQVSSEAETAGIGATFDDPCFSVSGTVSRIDRMNTQSGRAADTRVPVRNALVEMREEDTLFDDSYGERLTGADGAFSFSFCDDDGIFDDELEIYIRLRAELRSGGSTVVEVEDSSYIDEVYEFDTNTKSGEGGTFEFHLVPDAMQSGVLNIADAVFDAWSFWNASGGAAGDDATFDEEAEVHWEPGYDDGTSYYDGFWNEITVADGPADTDEFDDTVIIHEWGHFADDVYGCDDNPGGDHGFGQQLDPELSWGEGYPDYWQAAVRSSVGATDANFYIDAFGNGMNRLTLNLETTGTPSNAGVEDAIASMLWDLFDSANDGQDRVSHGHATIQQVYTDPAFESNGDIFDDTCTAIPYLLAWRALGKPTDTSTAAVVTQNIGLPNPFALAAASAPAQAAGGDGLLHVAAAQDTGTLDDASWWERVTMVADNSASMAGAKFNAVKTVMEEQVNDLDDRPAGVEFGLYTFNNVQPGAQETLRGQFYADLILPSIQGLSTRGEADPACQVNAFSALASAINDKHNGQAWLYTDGETTPGPGTEAIQQMLTTHGLRGSFVLLGGCSSAPNAPPNTSGAEYNFLGKAANATQPSGIVPYLLAAIASGGQFLFVNEAQLSDAADILRAQLSHSAGAGRWSDYVSDSDTYTWDRLTSWEYNWIDAQTVLPGIPEGTTPVEVTLPQPFPVYGAGYSKLRVYEDGYIQMGGIPSGPIIIIDLFRRYLNLLNADLSWYYIITAAADTPSAAGPTQRVKTQDTPDWFAITTDGLDFSGKPRAYQALLNKSSGEIRYQYQAVENADAGNAVISVEYFSTLIGGSSGSVVVSNKDVNGARPGTGYKFVPMPPQPAKTFTVPVDSQISGVGFLLTGYSGSFDPMDVRTPDGAQVDCNDTDDVLCLNLGLVQYVQVDVNGRSGVYTATVGAGATGQGTFSFSALAASLIKAESPFDHQLALGIPSALQIKLGTAAAGNQLTGWFQQPNGTRFGADFTLFDDGAHGDGQAGDGLFALPDFVPPGAGVGYLSVRGIVNNEEVQRSDPAPYNFQPLSVVGPATANYFGGQIGIDYTITNLDATRYCYDLPVQLPDGWTGQWQLTLVEVINGFCLNPGEAATRTYRVTPTSLQDPAPSGSFGEIAVTFREKERGQIADSAATTLVRYNQPATVEIVNHSTSTYIRPNNSDAISLTVRVLDATGFAVADGTPVDVVTTLGTVSPASGGTVNGQLPVVFTAGDTAGDALVTASSGAISATTVVHILNPLPQEITLAVNPADLSAGGSASLLARVTDQWGDPVAGQIVRVGVEGDGENGTVNPAAAGAAVIAQTEVVTLTTDAQGQVAAIFAKAAPATGNIGVRAELLFDEGAGLEVVAVDRKVLLLGHKLYLPALER
jgi:hypothetical protein